MQQAILDSAEFQKFAAEVARRGRRVVRRSPQRAGRDRRTTPSPNDLIGSLGDDLLARFKPVPLLDEYDIYEQLMTYWHDDMHDDVFLIMNEGWLDAAKPRKAIEDKDRKLTETPDLVIGTGKKAQQVQDGPHPASVDRRPLLRLTNRPSSKTSMPSRGSHPSGRGVHEEHAVEDGLVWDAVDEKGKVTQKSAGAALKEARSQDDDEVAGALEWLLGLLKRDAEAKKAAKEAQAALDVATLKKYGDLSDADVIGLVLDDKWKASVSGRVADVLTSLVLGLVTRIQELGERYRETVGSLDMQLDDLSKHVSSHLAAMGVR